jgi:aminopeptidase N
MKPIVWTIIFAAMLAPRATAQRLPQIAEPENYKLSFTPDLSSATFTGQEQIQVNLLKSSAEIVLNAAEITFQDANIASGGKTQTAKVALDAPREMATLSVEQPLPPGPATITIRFSGILNDELHGFYLGKDDHGRKYTATQFESTDARRAFPSFDEPAYKATFDVTVTAPKEMTVISNTKAISDSPGPDGKHTVSFATTPKMSSYLVAMVVGQFDYVEGSVDGIPIRVFSTAGKKQLGEYALQSAEGILHYYNQYFAIKYPYGKLDLIGLPDFSAGAMENTACITFRESLLLLDDQHASVNQHRSVAEVIAHEMAHQWFGDLVTMQWWDDVWLNEGFATWMSNKPIEKMKPEWNVSLDETLETVEALNVDSLANTRPIHQSAETPAEIGELFDGIAYGKAAAVLRMLESYLGPEVFRAGVNEYLKEHAYANATAEDFWNTMARSSHQPVDAIMSSFVKQPGAPIVSVKAQCANQVTTVTLSQERYFYDRSKFYEGDDQLWSVPVCLRESGADQGTTGKCEVLTKKEQQVSLPGCGAWVLANAGADGDYRSSYQPKTVQAISHDAESGLTPAERIMLLSDIWASMRVGRTDIGDYLTLAQAMQPDRNRAVVQYLLTQINYAGVYLVNDSDRPAFQLWVRHLLGPVVRDLGFAPKPGESDDQKNLRAAVLHTLGIAGADPEVLAEAHKQTSLALQDAAAVSPELAPVFFSIAALNGDAALYDSFMAKAKSSEIPGTYYVYLTTLSQFSDPKLLQRTLDYAISGQVRSQDVKSVIGQVMQNPAGRSVAWDFVRAHWTELSKAGGPYNSGALIGSAASLCDAEQENQVREFFSTHSAENSSRILKQTLERIDYCVDLKAREESPLSAWLGEHSDTAGQ